MQQSGPSAHAPQGELVAPLDAAARRDLQEQMRAAHREYNQQLAITAFTHNYQAQQAAAAAAAALVQGGGTDAALVPVPRGSGADAGGPGDDAAHSQPRSRDDPMGGAADDSIAGKRNHGAVDAARAIAARAKARAA